MTYRGTIRKGVVVLDGGATLPEGTPVTVAPLDKPDAKPLAPRGPKAGSAKGKVRISADFDEPLPDCGEYMK